MYNKLRKFHCNSYSIKYYVFSERKPVSVIDIEFVYNILYLTQFMHFFICIMSIDLMVYA